MSEIEMSQVEQFKYIICDNVADKITYENTLVKSVTFNISRYGKFNKKLEFDSLITIKEAIEKAEEYLSEKVTPEYYAYVKDDLFYKFSDYRRNMNYICSLSRGNLLTDCIYLEEIQVYRKSLSLWCSS